MKEKIFKYFQLFIKQTDIIGRLHCINKNPFMIMLSVRNL